jgi:hypothetical protein
MVKAWPSYTNVQHICCCTVLTALRKFEAFISKAFPFQRHLTGFWSNNVSKGRGGWKELGPLLLFNPLWPC